VIYNNSYYETRGSINYSNARAFAGKEGSLKNPAKLSSIFGFYPQQPFFYEYTDHRTQLKYLMSGKEINENGFRLHLFGYQYRVCLKFREIYDHDGRYQQLYSHLNGRGVYSIDEALKEMELSPLHSTVENFVSIDNIEQFRTFLTHSEKEKFKVAVNVDTPVNILNGFNAIIDEINRSNSLSIDNKKALKALDKDFQNTRNFFQLWIKLNRRKSVTKWQTELNSVLPVNSEVTVDINLYVFFLTLILRRTAYHHNDNVLPKLFDEFLLSKPISSALHRNLAGNKIIIGIELIKLLLISNGADQKEKKSKKKIVTKKEKLENSTKNENGSANFTKYFMGLLQERIVHNFLHVNEFEGITYFNKERFEQTANWILLLTLLKTDEQNSNKKTKETEVKKSKSEFEKEFIKKLKTEFEAYTEMVAISTASGYDLNKITKNIPKPKKERVNKSKTKKRKRKSE
jgi:hypothetical protein